VKRLRLRFSLTRGPHDPQHALSRPELEATIAVLECTEPTEEVQHLEEGALAKLRAQLEEAR
jgi:hypothetical protein